MFRKIALAAAAILGATVSASTASAREVPSRQIGDLARPISDKAIQCIIERNPELIGSWFNTLPGSSPERQLVPRLEDKFIWCNRTSAQAVDWVPQYDHGAMRVAILQYMLKSGSVDVPEARPPGLDRAAWYATDGTIPTDSIVANDLGFCLAKSDWPAARTVVLSARSSREETAALRSLIPLVGGCIPAGATLKIDKSRLRQILEETVYHAVGGATVGGSASPSTQGR